METDGEMKEAWHLFQIRRALLSTPHLGYSLGATHMHAPELRRAVASILYVNAVSLLDEAVRTRLSAQDLKGIGLRARLTLLDDRVPLLDYDGLYRICTRRNEIAPESNKDATVEELDGACDKIQSQLVAWNLAEDRSPYTLDFDVSTKRTSDYNYPLEKDCVAKVMFGDQWVAELKQTSRIGRISKK